MKIPLTPEQETWIKAHAAEFVLDESDDMAWAKPYVDEALAQVERGEVITLEEHRAHMAALLASLGQSEAP
jgi:antitoxin ParD1/3/4